MTIKNTDDKERILYRYGSFNFCNLPPWVIGSHHFNSNPKRIEIQGVRGNNRFLFDKLPALPTQKERAEFFADYMSVKFNLHRWEEQETDSARVSIKNSYQRFLKGWMIDSNSIAGAVLKHWVERRFGISPTFHRRLIRDNKSENYENFLFEAIGGAVKTSAIESQFDLLYEYCQYELHLRYPCTETLTLYRGTHDAEEYDILQSFGGREQIVRLNNLVSFTSEEERAWEFGRTVWQTAAPLSKVFIYSGLLTGSILKGEEEFVIIGGEYRVKKMR